MTRPVLFLAPLLAVAGMLGASFASATDGYFDTTFPGGSGTGHFTFDGNYSATSGSSSVQTLVTESNGRILLGGPADSGWWLGELLPRGLLLRSVQARIRI